MRKFFKVLKWIGISLVVIIIVLFTAVFSMQNKKYDAAYPAIHASTDSQMIARGEYLAFGPAHCANCHVPQEDAEKIAAGQHLPLRGGLEFHLEIGTIRSPNITPDVSGIRNMSDSEIARALRYGVGSNGAALFDFMPFHNLSDEDLTAVISFLRAQQPADHVVERKDLNFMGKAVYAFLLKPVGPVGEIPKSIKPDTTAAYGEYLANSIANCRGCHTERNLMTGAYTGQFFARGMKFPHPENGLTLVTPNLTPDKETGRIAQWNEEMFINRFRQGRLIKESEMPWDQFKQMSDNDLIALYNFLMSMQPIIRDNGAVIVNDKN